MGGGEGGGGLFIFNAAIVIRVSFVRVVEIPRGLGGERGKGKGEDVCLLRARDYTLVHYIGGGI